MNEDRGQSRAWLGIGPATRVVPLLLLLLLGTIAPAAYAFTSCTRIDLTNGPGGVPEEQDDPVVAGSSTYISYSDPSGLVVRASHDGGASWSSRLLDPAGLFPRIAVSGRHVYVVWVNVRDPQHWHVEFARSDDGGVTFAATPIGPLWVQKSQRGQPSLLGDYEPQISVADSRIAIVTVPAPGYVGVAVSEDGGASFERHRLPTPGVLPGEETIVGLGRYLAAVWNDIGSDGRNKIVVSVSSNGGRTFSAPRVLTRDGIDSREPLLAVSRNSGMLYMVWRESGTPHGPTVGYLSKSADFGRSWSKPQLLDPEARRARQFSVAAAETNVYVTYLRHRAPGFWWPQVTVSHDAGATFGPPIRLGNSGVSGMLEDETHAPRIWASGSLFRIVFELEGSLYIRSSGDGAIRLAPGVRLGRGTQVLVTRNTALWLGDNQSVKFAQCR